ncbi:MAG: 2-isopropylmalate synthase, partial [Ilumatobacteraceae bacterium]
MPGPLHVTATLHARGPAAAILLTDEQVASLAGGPKTPAVKVTVNGGYTFEGRIGRMGGEN